MATRLNLELETLEFLRRNRDITAREFVAGRKQIMAEQAKLNKKAVAIRARREAKRQQRLAAERAAERVRELAAEEARRVKHREAAALKRIRSNALFVGIVPEATNIAPNKFLKSVYDKVKGYTKLSLFINDSNTNISSNGTLTDFIKQFIGQHYDESNVWIIRGGDQIKILKPSDLPIERLLQAFRDGLDHCVFVPILSRLRSALETSKSNEVKRKLRNRIETLTEMSTLYATGVPEDKMESVAVASGFKIVINNILGAQIAIYNSKQTNIISFCNTRANHLDVGNIVLSSDSKKVSQNELNEFYGLCQDNDEFFMMEGDIKNDIPRKILTLNNCLEVADPEKDYYKEMDKLVGIEKYRFNATSFPDVNAFIKAGRIINSTPVILSNNVPTGHLDMEKAYTKFKDCSYYAGFLGVVQQWGSGPFDRAFIESHIGIYKFRVIKGSTVFGIKSVHILPSVEILYYLDSGLDLEILEGVWGSSVDFEFPDYMLKNRRYCNWSGRLGMEKHFKAYSFKTNKRWASHLKAEFGENCIYWEDKNLCTVKVSNKNTFTCHHIFAFITSYVRIQMLEALKKFQPGQVCSVVLDGIYFTGPAPDIGFRTKPIKSPPTYSIDWYEEVSLSVSWPKHTITRNTLLTGQGGSGKTFSVLNDKTGFNRFLFVTPQHTLGSDIIKKYNVSYTTIHKLIGQECRPWKQEKWYPPVLFIDEVTQIPADWIDKVFVMYPESLVILAGDLVASGQWFQTRNGKPGDFSAIWKPENVDIIHIDGDRRSRDQELCDLKLSIRNEMTRVFVNGDCGEDKLMYDWAKKNLKTVWFYDACAMFKPGDKCIAGTHKISETLLKMDIVTGWYKQGGFVEFEETEGYDKRGAFTIHSFQGRTLETGKIFVFLDGLFEYSMLYTAVSRAVNFDQLVFVL